MFCVGYQREAKRAGNEGSSAQLLSTGISTGINRACWADEKDVTRNVHAPPLADNDGGS